MQAFLTLLTSFYLTMNPVNIKSYDLGDFVFILGEDATDIFTYYQVKEMHGLNLADAKAEEIDKTKGNGVYIYGLTNFDPRDKKLTAKAPYKPFMFINKKHLKGDFTDITLINHEASHLSLIIHRWDVDKKEEEIVSYAEEVTNKLIKKFNFDRFKNKK